MLSISQDKQQLLGKVMKWQVTEFSSRKQDKDSSKAPEVAKTSGLNVCILEICMVFSNGKMRIQGLKHHYLAFKFSECFLAGFCSIIHLRNRLDLRLGNY
jgi:hypothetical protein